MIKWQWSAFSNLSLGDFYKIAEARQTVFINEQQCIYADLDGYDQQAWHLIAWRPVTSSRQNDKKLCAYLRVIKPKILADEAVLGRLFVVKDERGAGLAKKLMELAFANIQKSDPGVTLKISAQVYLQHFYESMGFKAISEPYDEDGIQHIAMLKPQALTS